MGLESGNIYAGVAPRLADEEIRELVSSPDVMIERIVSTGQASPPGHWYDQDREEWVILLRGGAGLRFDGEVQARVLAPGDYVRIPAHARHRVDWTARDEPTVWLAVHFKSGT